MFLYGRDAMRTTFRNLGIASLSLALALVTTQAFAGQPSTPGGGHDQPQPGGIPQPGQAGQQAQPGQPVIQGQPSQPGQPGGLQGQPVFQQGQGGQQGQQAGQQGHQGDMNLDRHIAQVLLIDNENEVALAKLAQKEAQSKDVKAFAEHMVKDHDEFIAQLQKFAGRQDNATRDQGRTSTTTTGTTGNQSEQSRTNQGQGAESGRTTSTQGGTTGTTVQTGTTDAGHMAQGDRFLQIKREIGQRCLASAQRELEQKKGEEFDHVYMGLQVFQHQQMIDELAVFRNHASQNLASVLKQGEETSERHLDEAKKLVKQTERGLERDTKSTSTERSSTDRNSTERNK